MFSKYFVLPLMLLIVGVYFSSCKNDDPEPPALPKDADTSILLYAVASNNLSSSFYDDMTEMEIGLGKVDLSKVDYFIYSVTQGIDPGPTLQKAQKNNRTGEVEFVEVKRYDRTIPSTDPARISEVISDYSALSQGKTRGLILWSHSTAWAPYPGTFLNLPSPQSSEAAEESAEESAENEIVPVSPEEIRWWGQDISNGQASYCNLPQLASSIPDHYFNFIWFDCCYMSSIEVIYEMRTKAEKFVAYPTEVLAEGAPYNIVLPFIAIPQPNLIAAADAMSEYYLKSNKIFTMAVIDPAPIEEIADMAQAAIPGTRLKAYQLQKYSRNGYYFYDFGQYTSTWGQSLGESWDKSKFDSLMDKLVVYKNCGTRLFNGQPLEKEHYSGISCGYFDYSGPEVGRASSSNDDDDDQKYYLELQWFKRVYNPFWPEFLQ